MKTDPERMDFISKGTFAPIYPLIAKQIVEKFCVEEGVCIDVGAGPAPLSIALAKITDLKIYAMDISDDMCRKAQENIYEAGLYSRIIPLRGDVQNIPFKDNSVDLVVSRGSMPFWQDLASSFKEINRVLKHEGVGYVGGGFGSSKMKQKIEKTMNKNKRNKEIDLKERYNPPKKISPKDLENAIHKANISNYDVINDDSGLWVTIRKF
jgi:ubiquinone/menaquinone biosynthesis C-methylase UbiE